MNARDGDRPVGGAANPLGTLGQPARPLNAARACLNGPGGVLKRLDRDKIAIVHVAKKQTGMADEVYREMLRELAGVESSKDLDATGFAKVMERFKTLGFTSSNKFSQEPPTDDEARRAGMASAAQRKYVRGLFREWHGADNPKALRTWLRNRFHIEDLRFATDEVARKAIEGLKVMTDRKKAAK